MNKYKTAVIILFLSGCSYKLDSLDVGHGESILELKKACDLNDGKRCAILGARYLGGLNVYLAGTDVNQDLQMAKKYSQRACKMNVAAGCYNLGKIYMLLFGKNDDPEYHKLGYKYIEKGCMLGAAGKCHKIWGWYYSRPHNMPTVMPRDKNPNNIVKFKKACNQNHAASCVKVGSIFSYGIDVKLDYLEAEKYYKKACDLNSAFGCNYLATTYLHIGNFYWSLNPKIDWEKVKKYYKKACDLGNQSSCHLYQQIHEKGRLY